MKISMITFCALSVCVAASAVSFAQDRVYIRLTGYDDKPLLGDPAVSGKPGWFEAKDFSFNIEQTLNIGSQSSGAGAGKITFNPFSFSKTPGPLDPKLFQMAASGTAFKTMEVEVDHASGVAEQFTFKLVPVKTVAWSLDPASKEFKIQISMEYGGLIVTAPSSKPGETPITGGWDRVKNVAVSQ